MLVLRILSTVFVGISFITGIIKNIVMLNDEDRTNVPATMGWSIYSIAWRVLIIVSIWLI